MRINNNVLIYDNYEPENRLSATWNKKPDRILNGKLLLKRKKMN